LVGERAEVGKRIHVVGRPPPKVWGAASITAPVRGSI
jgi:hypothetical protein